MAPEPVKQLYRSGCELSGYAAWKYGELGQKRTKELLEPWKNRYKGQRAVILGNGPSLRRTDWKLLKGENTFGLNRINLLFEEMGFVPTFYVCVKDLVIQQFSAELEAIPSKLKVFDFSSGRRCIKSRTEHIYIRFRSSEEFCTDIIDGWSGGYTVTFSALQLAYYLGFSKIVLVGVDHRFQAQGPAKREETMKGDDPNHFVPNYFGKGVKWALPDLEGSERAYRLAKAVYEADGREIVDATVDGELRVFRRISLADALS